MSTSDFDPLDGLRDAVARARAWDTASGCAEHSLMIAATNAENEAWARWRRLRAVGGTKASAGLLVLAIERAPP